MVSPPLSPDKVVVLETWMHIYIRLRPPPPLFENCSHKTVAVSIANEITSFVVFERVDWELKRCGVIDLLLLRVRLEVGWPNTNHCCKCWQRIGNEVGVQQSIFFV